jgi:uncharacterized protein (TIGR02246 family)
MPKQTDVRADQGPREAGALNVAMPDQARLADREALRELRARYSHYWDDGNAEAFIKLFTEDGVLQAATAGLVTGREQLRRMVAASIGRMEFTIHFTTDEVTEFTGEDTATGFCRFAVHTGRTPNMQGAGTYVDEYRRTSEGWRFLSRRQRFFYMGEANVPWPPTPMPVDFPYAG